VSLGSHPAVREALARCHRLAVHHHLETVTSTNDVALAAAREGQPLGIVVSADRQSAGRGRQGRGWTDDVSGPDGPGNLAVSVVVPLPGKHAALTPLITGLAVAASYRQAGAAPALKWPNDVLLDGCKAAGILVERHTSVGSEVVVIGCGLDLDWRGVDREGATASWTSLAESLGAGVDRGAVLAALLIALDEELTALAAATDTRPILDRYREECSTIGREVNVVLPGGARLTGRAVDLDADGLLVVDTGRERVSVRAGDVSVLAPE
jgi:BirA family transcriptional regulator, biotin operon repressor / biotin---[acetyl-CoA-carboxylase] ligase